MKRLRTFLLLLAVIFCVQGALPASQAQAATKSGLVKEKGKYYYYQKGKKQKKTWKTVKVNGKSYRYYFGSDGAAYAGKTVDGVKVPAVKTVGKAKYAFGTNGRMLTGVQVVLSDSGFKLYYFSGNGKYNSAMTAKLRKAAKYKADYAVLLKLLKSCGAKPKKTEYYGFSCFGDGEDGTVYFSNFEVAVFKPKKGKTLVMDVYISAS